MSLEELIAYIGDLETHILKERHAPVSTNLEKVMSARKRLPDPARRLEIRRNANVSREVLAQQLGVSPTAVYGWERGTKPSSRHVVGYVEILEHLEKNND
jgi:DNA-binding transcriptional regulator YiaG